MAESGYKIATGYVEIKLGDQSVFIRATGQAVKRVADQFEQTLTSRVSQTLASMGEKFSAFGEKASLYLAPLTVGLAEMVKQGIDTARAISTATNMFEQFGLTAGQAADLVQKVYDRSNAWGQSFPAMLEQTQRLMGIFAGNVGTVDLVQNAIGNLTGKLHIAGETADRVTTAIVQMYTKPSIQAEELLQLSEAGIDGWTLMADATGKSVAQLRKLSEQGKLLSSDVMPKLMSYLTQNPNWAGFAVANSRTLNGQLAIMHNQLLQVFAGPIVQNNAALVSSFQGLNGALTNLANSGVVSNVLTPLVNGFTSLINWLGRLTPATQQWIVRIALIGAVIGPAVLIIGKLLSPLSSLVGGLGRAGSALRSWLAVNNEGASSSVRMGRAIDGAFRAVNSAGQALIYPITSARLGFINLQSAFNLARTGAYVLASDGLQALRVASRVTSESVSSFRREVELFGLRSAVQLRAGLARAGDQLQNLGTAIRLAAISGLERLKSAAESTQRVLSNGLASAAGLAADGMKRMGSAVSNLGGRAFQGLKIGALGLIGALGTALLSNDQFRSSVENLMNVLTGALAGPLSNIVNILTGALAPVLPIVANLIGQVGNSLASVATQAAPILVPILTSLANILAQGLAVVLPKIVSGALSLLSALSPLVPIAIQFGSTILGLLLPPLAQLGSQLAGQLGPVLPQIAALLGKVVAALAPIVELVVDFGIKLLGILIPPAIQIVGILGNLLVAVFPLLGPIGQIIGLVAGLAAMFLAALLPAVQPILKILLDLISSCLQPLMPLITTVAGILAGTLAAGFRLIEPLIRLAASALQGMVTAISDALGWIGRLVDKISGAASAVGSFLSKINPFGSLSASVTPQLNLSRFTPNLRADMAVSPNAVAIPFSGSVSASSGGSLTGTAASLHDALAAFGAALGQQLDQFQPPARSEADASPPDRPAPQITVNAKTNADPYEIGREIAWQLRTSGR